MNGKATSFGRALGLKTGATRINKSQVTRRKGLTPVISTLIIISVTLTTSISTAFWMRSAGYVFTGFEKLECKSANPSYDYPSRTWKISIVVQNVGTMASKIVQVYANEVALSPGVTNPAPGNGGSDISIDGVSINQGATISFNIYCRQGGQSQPFSTLVGRQTLLIKFATEEGHEYIQICELCPPAA
jgi:hypothetical protein